MIYINCDLTRWILQEVGCVRRDWIDPARDKDRWRALVNDVLNLGVPLNAGNFFAS
jgi:hypothetical protein